MRASKLNKKKWITPKACITIVATMFLGFCVLNSNATSYTIENGTSESSTTQASPVNNYFKSYHLQFLYTADELYELGWTAGKPATISQLGFYATQAPTNALPNWTIKMKNTSALDASSHDGSGLTTVYTVSSYAPTASTYDMRTFSTNFSWDGVSNILVDICWDIASAFSSTGKCRAYNYKNGGRYVRADSPAQCGVSTSTLLSYKPAVKLELTASTSAPANDAICSATSLTVDGDCKAGTNYFGTTVSGDAAGSCWVASTKSHTVWYSFTAPSDGAADIYVEAFGYHTLTNTQVAIFSSSNNACSGTLTAVGCDENTGTPGCTNCAYEQLTGLTSGNTYFVEVDGNSTDTGSFCISVLSAVVAFDNSSGDNKWNTASNWSNNIVPTSTTNVIINSGSPYIPSNTTAQYCNNITIANGYTLRVESGTNAGSATSFSIYGNMTNNGTITHNGNYYMNIYGNNQQLGGSGTYTTTSGVGPGYSFADGSKVTLTSDLTGFNYINIDGVVELGSKTLQTTNFTIASVGQLKQNTGTLEIKAAPTFTGIFLPQQGLTYYNISGATYDVDDATEYYNLKLRCNSTFLVRQGGLTGYTCNNLELTNSGASSYSVLNLTITVTGNFTIGANCYIDLNDGTQRTMKVAGNIINNGTGFDTPADGTLELNGSATQTISGTAFTLNDVIINNTDATGINLSTAVTLDATGILTLTDGIINTTTANILTLGTGATVTGGDGSNASHINGPMNKNTNTAVLFKFPVGEEGVYKPIGVKPSTTNSHTFRTQAWNDSPNDVGYTPTAIETGQLNNVSTVEYWDVNRVSGSDAATVRLYWASGAVASGITDETSTDLRVAHWKSSTTKWEDLGQSAISSTNDWVEASGITSFSPFSLGSDGAAQNPLPVELISFDAKPKGNTVELTWVTASEKDNAYFEVQRSINGKDFERVSSVRGAGNSLTTIEYLAMDESPVAGVSYYQLKQVDFDGTSDYSKIVTVHYKNGKNFELISISPSVANTFTKLTINVKDPDDIITYVYDNKGDLLIKEKHTVLEGYNELKLDVSGLSTGVYYIVINSSNELINTKFIKSENYIY